MDETIFSLKMEVFVDPLIGLNGRCNEHLAKISSCQKFKGSYSMCLLIAFSCAWNFCAGYLYNYQTKEFYNLTYVHEQPEVSVRFGG